MVLPLRRVVHDRGQFRSLCGRNCPRSCSGPEIPVLRAAQAL